MSLEYSLQVPPSAIALQQMFALSQIAQVGPASFPPSVPVLLPPELAPPELLALELPEMIPPELPELLAPELLPFPNVDVRLDESLPPQSTRASAIRNASRA